MAFTVCTENPIENVKSYGLNFIKILYAEKLSDKQWKETTNRNRIWLENVLPTWMQ